MSHYLGTAYCSVVPGDYDEDNCPLASRTAIEDLIVMSANTYDLSGLIREVESFVEFSLFDVLPTLWFGATPACLWASSGTCGDHPVSSHSLPHGMDWVCGNHEYRIEQAWEMDNALTKAAAEYRD